MYVAFDVFACVLWAIYFWDFICLKSIYFPGLFSHSSLNGPMRFSHPVDTTDRRNIFPPRKLKSVGTKQKVCSK